MNNTLHAVNTRMISLKATINSKKFELQQMERSMQVLREQRERILYGGRLKHEFLAHLHETKEKKEVDGFIFVLDDWKVHGQEFTIDDGTTLKSLSSVYTDQQDFKLTVTTFSGHERTYLMWELPKKYKVIGEKMREAAFSLKVVEPDDAAFDDLQSMSID